MFVFCLLSALTFAAPPCITRMIAGNFDVYYEPGEIVFNKKCYEDVPNYSSEVYGHNMKTECAIHESMLEINKGGNPLSRCGQCLELIGPSRKAIDCVVTQTFKFNGTATQIQDEDLERSIGVNAEILTLLTTNALGTNEEFSQVTVREVDCKFKEYPSLFVVDTNETTATLQIINSNKIIEKISANHEDEYYITPDAHFYVPINSNLNKILAYAFDGNSSSFFDVNLTTLSSYTSDILMPIDTYEECSFVLANYIYSSTIEYEDEDEFCWTYYSFKNGEGLTDVYVDDDDKLIFNSGDETAITIVFKTPNIVLLNKHFNDFHLNIKSDKVYSNPMSFVVHQKRDANTVATESIKLQNLDYMWYSENMNDSVITNLRFVIPLDFSGFANVIAFRFVVEQNTVLEILEAYFGEREDRQFKDCELESLYCYDKECTYEGDEETDLPWIKGCEPNCGICRTGYQCSKEGKCIIQTNYNIRSYSNSSTILLVTFVILFIIA